MKKKLCIIFILSAVTGSILLFLIFCAQTMRGPELTLHSVTVELNEEVNAWTFVTECSAQNASVHYLIPPDFSTPGGQEVEIEAVDSQGRKTVKKALLRVSIIKNNLKLDATGQEIQLSQILVNGIDASQVSFKYKPIVLNHVGEYDIRLLYQNVEYEGTITVVDVQPPEVVLKDNIVVYQKHTFDPASAAQTIIDTTDVTAGLKGILDTGTLGTYPVILTFTDEGENVTELTAQVQVIEDIDPPQISGALDREYYIGENISYLEGVTAWDEVDGDCEVYVDNHAVQTDVPGSYEVTYSANDQSGNQAVQTVVFTLKKISATEERLNEKADEVLAAITDDSMSLSRKAYAVYNYAYSNIQYTGTSDKSDWEAEAYRGLQDLKGDCFTYFSVCKILLNRLGIQTMDVQKLGGSAEHYWLMVNTGSGWYHFDATRRKVYFDGFMARDTDIEAYTAQVGDSYYTFDHTGYPATPQEKYIMQ